MNKTLKSIVIVAVVIILIFVIILALSIQPRTIRKLDEYDVTKVIVEKYVKGDHEGSGNNLRIGFGNINDGIEKFIQDL